jgi:hypothetical protein
MDVLERFRVKRLRFALAGRAKAPVTTRDEREMDL